MSHVTCVTCHGVKWHGSYHSASLRPKPLLLSHCVRRPWYNKLVLSTLTNIAPRKTSLAQSWNHGTNIDPMALEHWSSDPFPSRIGRPFPFPWSFHALPTGHTDWRTGYFWQVRTRKTWADHFAAYRCDLCDTNLSSTNHIKHHKTRSPMTADWLNTS